MNYIQKVYKQKQIFQKMCFFLSTSGSAPPLFNLKTRGSVTSVFVRMAGKSRTSISTGNSSIVNLLVCISGIYICYLSYGIFQEKIFTYRTPKGEKFTATLFMLFVQCVTNALVAYSGMSCKE